jgi:hypothetical protein
VSAPLLRGSAAAESAASPQAVWDALLDGGRWSFWNPGVEWLWLEGDAGPGTPVTIKLRRVRQTALVLTELLPRCRFGLALTIGPVARLDITWTLAAHGAGTRIAAAVTVSGFAGALLLGRSAARIAQALPGHVERLAAYALDGKEKNARLD